MEDKIIKVKVSNCKMLPLVLLEENQRILKKFSEEARAKLKNSLIKNGLSAPFFVWKNQNKLMDGHFRKVILRELINEGWKLETGDFVPVVEIEAEHEKEAAKLILIYSSQYGEITREGLTDFLDAFELEKKELADMVKFLDQDYVNNLLLPQDDKPASTKGKAPSIAQIGDIWRIGNLELRIEEPEDDGKVELRLVDKALQMFTEMSRIMPIRASDKKSFKELKIEQDIKTLDGDEK